MPIVRTLINYNIKLGLKERSKFTDPVAEISLQSLRSFLPTLSSKLTDLVIDRPSEDKLPVFVHEDLKAVVLETYNDLVLCCAGKYYQRDYCICNPYTQKWVALPPSPQCHKIVVALGFICDPPYYSYYGEEAEFHRKEATQQRNAAEYIYRHRVVRIPEFSHCQDHTFKYYVEISSLPRLVNGECRMFHSPKNLHSIESIPVLALRTRECCFGWAVIETKVVVPFFLGSIHSTRTIIITKQLIRNV